jgi:uncharacterized protein (TIGR03435 family)
MKGAEHSNRTPLERHLGRYGVPPVGQVEASVERVWTRLAPEAVDTPRGLIVRPAPRYSWPRALTAAAVLAAAIAAAIVWPREDEALYRSLDGIVLADSTLRTESGAGGLVTLRDGSRVEIRSNSELSLERRDDGVAIRLRTGGIIVNAAKRRSGHLYVETKDMTVAVVGTVFAVNAADDGVRVTVIEGEVRVREGTSEMRLRPGEHLSTSPTLAERPLSAEVAWSRHSAAYNAILAAFAKGMADTSGPLTPLRESSTRSHAAVDQGGVAQARQEFDEAAIRECDPDNLPPTPPGARGGGANSFQMTPGRTYALCMTLATLIRTAYGYGPAALDFLTEGRGGRGMSLNAVFGLGVEDGLRVRGGPDWIRSERYTVEAVANGPADAETMRGPMLRALLERRFQLKAHIESEQVPAFALVVAPGGLKIKPAEADSCVSFKADPTVPMINGAPIGARRPTLDEVRRGEKPLCGQFGYPNGPNQVLIAGGATFGGLAQQLAPRVGNVRVFDRTGIADRFNWILEFERDPNAPGLRGGPPPAVEPSDIPKAPMIFAALEEQLGLRLEPAQAPREFIVIDQIERPSPN